MTACGAAPGTSMPAMAMALLPEQLLHRPWTELALAPELLAHLHRHGVLTLADLLQLPESSLGPDGWLQSSHVLTLREALAACLRTDLPAPKANTDSAPTDWPAVYARLQHRLPTTFGEALATMLGQRLPRGAHSATSSERASMPASEAELRAALRHHARDLCERIDRELPAEFRAHDGVLDLKHAAAGSQVRALGQAAPGSHAPLRLIELCSELPCCTSGGLLYAVSQADLRRLQQALRRIVTPARLPLAIDAVLAELKHAELQPPRGTVVQLLRRNLRFSISWDASLGEAVVPDPRSPTLRLAGVLLELGGPTSFEELFYAYRERYRRAHRARLQQRLRRDSTFLQVGADQWSVRSWHASELTACMPLADQIARTLCARGGKQDIFAIAAEHGAAGNTPWLLWALLAQDPRIRLLGRGEACAATHVRSQVLEQLLQDFRRAGGDVVTSLFIQNQPATRQRLVARLLRENQCFVSPAADRVDLLTNYPFNTERLLRVRRLVDEILDALGGHASVLRLKQGLDGTDLGGGWLTVELLADLLRRQGPYEVLPGGIVALRSRDLPNRWLRCIRQVLRRQKQPLSLERILLERPEFTELTECLRGLMEQDPCLRVLDGDLYCLA